MKLKLLLLILLIGFGVVNAQDTIRTLIITEARMNHHHNNYIEITNVGDFDIELSEFEFGLIRPFGGNVLWTPEEARRFMLPEKILKPGECFVLATAYDFSPKQFAKGLDDYLEKITPDDMWELADLMLHHPEALHGEPGDSVTNPTYWTFESQNGRGCWFLRQHLSESDSVVVDQVGGVFDAEGGLNFPEGNYDVAGVAGATANSVLVRKFSVKKGTIDFATARGIGLDDSEWIPIPFQGDAWRDPFWTVGNHGDYNLDANTLESSAYDINFDNKTITVPWGTRSNDDIMRNIVRKPGVGWNYLFSQEYEDSLYMGARTGDQLKIFVCGKDLDAAVFDIIVEDPPASANIVTPKYNVDPEGDWRELISEGEITWPRVTRHESGVDTITGAQYGLPFATRIDSLLERLEKAPGAKWDFEWVDGVKRVDLKDGDVLKVTAENGSVKEYYIQVQAYRNDDNALLASITWPDIPDMYRDILGWQGDTIPGFSPTTFVYKLQVPLDYEGIPALVAKTQDLNATIQINRASSLDGTIEQRTISYTVIAEDDTTISTYTIELAKEKNPINIQPYFAEPFISEYVFWYSWGPTNFFEICNPGNQVLDLSNYMFVGIPLGDPAAAINAGSGVDNWGIRYLRYIPGYKWVSEADWQVTPSILERDLNVNPLVMPGDVFVLGQRAPWHPLKKALNEIDIDFINNPWGESIKPWGQTCTGRWKNHNWYLFKILNDSLKQGLKPVGDFKDFELIEVFGTGDGSDPQPGVGYVDMVSNLIRKPQFTTGRTIFNESFSNPPGSEWEYKSFLGYWIPNGVGNKEVVTWDLGSHFFLEPTHYKSTITSVVYKVSKGYSMNELIRGPRIGTTVSEFLGNIVKANDNQTLTVKAVADGSELGMDVLLTNNDTLVVLSADSTNTSKYVLEVTEQGLSSNALLTSTLYDINVDVEPKSAGDSHAGKGSIQGFEYGTALKTIIANITVPPGANLSVINDDGMYVPLLQLNFDTSYVDVTVNHNTFFEVIAEDGTTTIMYQLQPEVSENTAFVTSDVYYVIQRDLLIKYIPRGTTVGTFLNNIVPSLNATVSIVDKMGNERMEGNLSQDDKLIVTSPNGKVQKVYHFSMLRTEYIVSTTYLAYVLSNTYDVDQISYKISGATASTLLSDFYSKISPAMGATAVVVDSDGVEKTSGDLDDGDMLKVTSADGQIEVMYTLELDLTSADEIGKTQIQVYPNPTSGKLNVAGNENSVNIHVINSMGQVIQSIKSDRSLEVIDINNQPSGMYFITITNEERMMTRFKVLKR
ncbi:MAG: T9SS type A sorting domain-containing protein [Draconibacterium sp.]|nr:T9SS type A sorting domain-containing protein [Draconibacterium sp.]